MSIEQKAESCPEFVTQDQMIEAEELINEMNKSYVQQSTNPELQTQDSAVVTTMKDLDTVVRLSGLY